jgi:hypothetical protein
VVPQFLGPMMNRSLFGTEFPGFSFALNFVGAPVAGQDDKIKLSHRAVSAMRRRSVKSDPPAPFAFLEDLIMKQLFIVGLSISAPGAGFWSSPGFGRLGVLGVECLHFGLCPVFEGITHSFLTNTAMIVSTACRASGTHSCENFQLSRS